MKIDPTKQFSIRECPACSMDVPENTNRCPICGYEFPAEPLPRKQLKWALAVFMLIVFVVVVSGLF